MYNRDVKSQVSHETDDYFNAERFEKVHILLFILFGGLLIKSSYTHFISKRKRYFAFDDRRYTEEDDFLKIERLNIKMLERVFLVIMTLTYAAALILLFTGQESLSIWVLATVLAWQFLLSSIIDFKLYTAFHDKSHLVLSVIWVIAVVIVYVGVSRIDVF